MKLTDRVRGAAGRNGRAADKTRAIEIKDLTVRYGRRKGTGEPLVVLRDFSLDVRGGELLTIVGPSGCGKSTLLKVIAKLVPAVSGSVRFDPDDSEPRVGFVFQDYFNALAPWRTVLRNVELGLEIEGVPREARRERARKHLDLVGLGAYENAYPRELSGGMQQRVQLARVLAYDPMVLLMDEPFGSLDAQIRRVLQSDLRRILEELNRTVIFVTHDIEEALYLGDRVIALSAAPARILLEIEQPERPEDLETFLQTERCQQQRAQVWEVLRDEIVESSPA
jgi:NitT/TauT family transport system ATP-binding protein